ncbi:MAG: Clp protease ClpP [Synechococcaceae cyanobacterium SM1_2_3]|nr:Clp protease ClpP [Synechococcaceae cyanobacterium SM1_2_3]
MEIQLYDEITPDTAKRVTADLAENPDAPVAIRINSYGGCVFSAIAICNALKNHRGKVTTYNDGIAASAASLILCAGNKVVMAENAC